MCLPSRLPIVAYVRVSTSQQGRSGLGIEAQRAALARLAESEGFEIVAEFVEVETGKGSDALDRRPEPAAALAKARALRYPVAKLDRLSRDAHFVSGLTTWWGTMSLGEVAQVTAAFITVQAALNWLVENHSGLEDCLSSVHRVAALLIVFDERGSDGPCPEPATPTRFPVARPAEPNSASGAGIRV